MSTPVVAVRGRMITLTREGQRFRLAFPFDRDILEQVKALPYATFDKSSKSWTTVVSRQSLDRLRRMYGAGLLDLCADDFIHPGEVVEETPDALLRRGQGKRPFVVQLATRDSRLYPAFSAIPGSRWVKELGSLTFPAEATGALADMFTRGVLADPERLLLPSDANVLFDLRTGNLRCLGNPSASAYFPQYFPQTDVVAGWLERGLDVSFSDPFTEQVYRGELARNGSGFTPEGMKIDLKPYQAVTVAVALERDGLGVWHEPGLGKTAIAIATGHELLQRGTISRVVVVAPAAVKSQWGAEIKKFGPYDDSDIAVVGDNRKKRAEAYEKAESAKWLIVNYDALTLDAELPALFNGAFVVADEVHKVKNYAAKRTKALMSLAEGSAKRMGLSGTPIETDVAEWYQLISGFLVPGALGNPHDFNNQYRYKAPHGGYEGTRNIPELRERSKPHYIRFTKAQVAKHLPPLQVSTLALDPSPKYAGMLRRAHTEAVKEMRADRLESYGMSHLTEADLKALKKTDPERHALLTAGNEMTAIGQLRLLCSSPRLVSPDCDAGRLLIEANLVPDEDGPKVDEIRTMCASLAASQRRRLLDMELEGRDAATAEEVTGERVVMFTFSKRMANLLSERLTADGVKHVLFTGDTNQRDRDAAVAAFTDPTSDVIAFIATDAAAEGLNLGTCCATLVNIDLPWTPGRLAQRSQRIHRLDSTAGRYQVTNLMVTGTMEHGVAQLLGQRSDTFDRLIGEQGGRDSTTGRHRKHKQAASSVAMEALALYSREHPDAELKPKRGRAAKAKPPSEPGVEAPDQASPEVNLSPPATTSAPASEQLALI